MSWIRTVYLYLFALLGLVLITVGSVQLVGLGLRTWVLTDADAEARVRHSIEPPLRPGPERIENLAEDTTLDEETRRALRSWAEDYHRMREQRAAIDPVRSRRQREAAGALALLLVGVPLYLYHWRTIHRERGDGPAPG
jgi:hypothetical protein